MKKLLLFLMAVAFIPIHLWAQTADYSGITPEQLPAGTKVIPEFAFQNRTDLVEVTIPEGVEIIEAQAFAGCSKLQKVTLPTTLVCAFGAFPWCYQLKDVTCLGVVPPFIGQIPYYSTISLNSYQDLASVYEPRRLTMVEGLSSYATIAGWYVYDNTDMDEKTREIIKNIKGETDENLGYISYIDLTVPYKLAPSTYGLYGYDTDPQSVIQDDVWPYDYVPELTYRMRDHILRYPSIISYELEPGWNHFPAFQPFDAVQPTILRVGNDYTLSNSPFTQKPDLTVAVSIDNKQKAYYAGHMSVLGGTHSYGTFNLEQDAWENDLRILEDKTIRATELDKTHATLYTEAPMRADVVKTTLRFNAKTYSQWLSSDKWIFTSLPFDCRLSDLKVTEGGNNLQWVIYKHSGQMRADAKFSEVWVKQTTDSILHAGEGFILMCGWNDCVDSVATLELTAINNANKNRIFTTEDVSIPLHDYPAIAESHRSWNFIGNPYPCYYSTRYFEPSTPFVISNAAWFEGWSWSHSGYQTFSPVDDDYLLAPFQGFFVQRPLGYDALNFPEYGRFVTVDEYENFMGDLMSEPDFSVRTASTSYVQRRMGPRRVAAPLPLVGKMEKRRVINLRLKNMEGVELDRTRLVGNPDASIEYETICDATKFPDFSSTATLLYLIGKDDTHYAISEQPFVEGDEVNVGAKFPVAGEYTLIADFKTAYPELEGKLMLIDYETGNVQLATEPYTFTAQAGETTTRFALSYGSESTGISQTVNRQLSTVNYYDLAGRKVTGSLHPGIYIKNGKKIIIK